MYANGTTLRYTNADHARVLREPIPQDIAVIPEIFMRIVVIVLLCLIVASLASALGFLLNDRGRGRRTATALSLRVGISIVLFVVLMAAYHFGFIQGKL